MVLSLGIDWGDAFEPVMTTLQEARTRAETKHEQVEAFLGERLFGIYPGGTGTGEGKGIYFAYRGITAAYRIQFANLIRPKRSTPNVMVTIGSQALMQRGGLRGAWSDIRSLFGVLGGTIIFAKPSRVDICADIPEIDMGAVAELVRRGCCVKRARDVQYFETGYQDTGVRIGKGNLSLRIYDKLRELESKPDVAKKNYLIENRWGCLPDRAIRVEYQLRRDTLKSCGIDTVEDYFEKRSSLVRYLSEEWFRLTKEPVDRTGNHQSRAANHEIWDIVCAAFRRLVGTEASSLSRVSSFDSADTAALDAQAIGCMMRSYVMTSTNLEDGVIPEPSEFLEATVSRLMERLESLQERYYERFQNKFLEQRTSTPLHEANKWAT